MAKNKTPRKKYRPRRTLLSGCGSKAFIFAAKAVSNEPLSDDDIADITAPMAEFIAKLKAGTADVQDFQANATVHYLYAGLLAVLRAAPMRADPDTELRLKLEIDMHYTIAAGHTPDILAAIAERAEKRGRWLATGDELKTLDAILDTFRAVLGIASWQHYIQAFKETEPVIGAEIHRLNRAQEQNKMGAAA